VAAIRRVGSLRNIGRATCTLLLALSACQQQPAPQAQRIALDQAGQSTERALPSPDTARAVWTVSTNGKAIHFGNRGAQPWLTLDCRLEDRAHPQLAVIRHAPAFPGQTALFAVLGNGYVSRLPASATLAEGEWRWEASLPAADRQWNLFIGTGDMRATLPGKGAIEMPANPIPGEFVTWCRAGGRAAPAATPSPAPSATPSVS
jgi:hypothetical protein